MTKTSETENDTEEYGRMVELRVCPDHEWGLGREHYMSRQRPIVLRNLILVGKGLTIVLTP